MQNKWPFIWCQGVKTQKKNIGWFACCFLNNKIMLHSPLFHKSNFELFPYFSYVSTPNGDFASKRDFHFLFGMSLGERKKTRCRKAATVHSSCRPIIINVIMLPSDLNFCFQFLYFFLEVPTIEKLLISHSFAIYLVFFLPILSAPTK